MNNNGEHDEMNDETRRQYEQVIKLKYKPENNCYTMSISDGVNEVITIVELDDEQKRKVRKLPLILKDLRNDNQKDEE